MNLRLSALLIINSLFHIKSIMSFKGLHRLNLGKSSPLSSSKFIYKKLFQSIGGGVSDWTEKRVEFSNSDKPNIVFSATSSYSFTGDMLVVPFYKPKEKDEVALQKMLKNNIPDGLSTDLKSIVSDLIAEGEFKADVASKQFTRVIGNSNVKYVCLVGLGPDPKSADANDIEITTANRLGKSIGAIVKESKIQTVGLVLPKLGNSGLTQLVLGLYESAYNDNR